MKPEIVVMGHIVKEMIEFPDRTLGPVLGGPAAYCSVIAARLGGKAGVVTRVGKDMPEELLRIFDDAGVDTAGIKVEGDATTSSILIYSASGEKRIEYPSKAPPLEFEDVPTDYLAAKVIYVCPMDYETSLQTLGRLRDLDCIMAVDLGGYGGAHSPTHPDDDEKSNPAFLPELVAHFDIVRSSVEDSRHLLGDRSPEEAAGLFVQWGAEVGVVTLGEDGVLAATSQGNVHVPALSGEVVDCTGAGDAFSLGFLIEYHRTGDVAQALRYGCAVSLHVIEGTGGVTLARMPTATDVKEKLESYYEG